MPQDCSAARCARAARLAHRRNGQVISGRNLTPLETEMVAVAHRMGLSLK